MRRKAFDAPQCEHCKTNNAAGHPPGAPKLWKLFFERSLYRYYATIAYNYTIEMAQKIIAKIES